MNLPPEHGQHLETGDSPPSEWSVDQWIHEHYKVYGDNNRDKGPLELWMHAVTEGSALAENVRRARIGVALTKNVVGLFGWLAAFVGKYLYEEQISPEDPIGNLLKQPVPHDLGGDESFAKWILTKYPFVCPACGDTPCICSSHRNTFETRKEGTYGKEIDTLVKRGHEQRRAAIDRLSEHPEEVLEFRRRPLDRIVDFFIFLYGGGTEGVDLWQITAHLLEEIGEVSEQIIFLAELDHRINHSSFKAAGNRAWRMEGRPGQVTKALEQLLSGDEEQIISRLRTETAATLKKELADVFSWLCAVLYKINELYRNADPEGNAAWRSMSSQLEGKFCAPGMCCPTCHSSPCDPECRTVRHMRKYIRQVAKTIRYSGEEATRSTTA